MGRKYRQRERYLTEALELIDRLRTEISFSNEPVAALLIRLTESFPTGGLKDTAEYYAQNIADSALPKKPPYLDAEDYRIVERLFGTLGKSDIRGQEESLDSVKAALTPRLEKARAEAKGARIYPRLGLMAGFGLAIAII